MNEPTTSLRRAAVVACFICGAGWWFIFRLTTGMTLEDALITYRYAQNLASGNGFVFNAGEPVLGTTTPLLTMFLAAVGKILDPSVIPLAATLTMGCLGILTGIAVYYILAELRYPFLIRILSIPLFFGSELILVTSVGGMETPLVLFCMATSGLAFLRRRPMACLLISGILVVTRLDGIIWAALMTLAVVLQSRRIPWKAVLAAGCVVLPWLLFAVWYFGSPVPHSVLAKQAIGSSAGLASPLSVAGLRDFTGWYICCTGFCISSPVISIWLLVLALGVASYLSRVERRGVAAILVGYLVLYGLFLYAGRAPHFEWYLAPALLCSVLLISPGVSELSCVISERLLKANQKLRIAPAIAFAIVACYCFAQNYGIVRHYFEFQQNELHTRRAIGLWLQNNTPRESVVAMEAVGYQAFFSQRAVIDLAGIVSPSVVALKRETSSNAELFFKVLSELKPDYIVLRSFEVDENRCFHGGRLFETDEQRGYFFGNYTECKRFAAPYPNRWGDLSFLTIYARDAGGCGEASNEAIDGKEE